MFENVLFFINCTEQNTKENISLIRCCLLIKIQRRILKWYASETFLKQLRSSDNRPTPKTSAKDFCPAY